ncbi:MAG: class I SAM-dependent methyltransferase [Candidatus Bipolaricaulia bacterium]
MSCCKTEGTNRFFSRQASRMSQRFRNKGLGKSQMSLVEGIKRGGIEDKDILEIGFGVGFLHMSLLETGARGAVGVEISEGMAKEAEKLAEELSYSDRVDYHLGDFVEIAPELPEADITILDKVICCYPDAESLVNRSLGKTRDIYAVTYPRPTWWVWLGFKVQVFVMKLLRFSFHPFYHDSDRIQGWIRAQGFEKIHEDRTPIWLTLVYQKQ